MRSTNEKLFIIKTSVRLFLICNVFYLCSCSNSAEDNKFSMQNVDSSSAHLTENKYKDSPEMFGHFKYYMTEEDYNLINSFYYKNTYSIGSGVYTFKPLFYNDSLIMITLFLNAESPFQSIDETLGLINKKYGQPEYDDYVKSQVMIDWRTSESTKIKAIKNYKTKSHQGFETDSRFEFKYYDFNIFERMINSEYETNIRAKEKEDSLKLLKL